MKEPYELLRQKEEDLARVRHEVESLKVVASLLSEGSASDEPDIRKGSVSEKTLDASPVSEATGTDGPFSASIPASRQSLWNSLKRGK